MQWYQILIFIIITLITAAIIPIDQRYRLNQQQNHIIMQWPDEDDDKKNQNNKK